MEISMENENSQLLSNQQKYEKDSPIDLPLKNIFETEIIQKKSNNINNNKQIIKKMLQRIIILESKIQRLQKQGSQNIRRKKKLRRKAKQIKRDLQCNYRGCQKIYGSKTSLKNHMKLKHGIRMRRYILQNKQNKTL